MLNMEIQSFHDALLNGQNELQSLRNNIFLKSSSMNVVDVPIEIPSSHKPIDNSSLVSSPIFLELNTGTNKMKHSKCNLEFSGDFDETHPQIPLHSNRVDAKAVRSIVQDYVSHTISTAMTQ